MIHVYSISDGGIAICRKQSITCVIVFFKLYCSKNECGDLGSFGGDGGTPFDDGCFPDDHITAVELSFGPITGICKTCLRSFRVTFRYNLK